MNTEEKAEWFPHAAFCIPIFNVQYLWFLGVYLKNDLEKTHYSS